MSGNDVLLKSLVITLFMAIGATSMVANDAQLILISPETSIKPRQQVVLELFLYNPNSKPVRAPVLAEYSIESATKDVTGKLTPGGGTQFTAFDVMLPLQTLRPKSIQHETIRVEINNTRPGEFVEVYVEIGRDRILRSNSILLFCSNNSH